MSGSEMTNVGGSSGGVDGGGMQNPPTGPPQPVTQNIPVVAGSEGNAASRPVAGNGSGRGNGNGNGSGSGRGRGRGRGNGDGESSRKRRGRPRKYGPETSMAIPLSFAPPRVTIATPPPQQRQRIHYRQLPPYHLLQQLPLLSQQQQQQQSPPLQEEQPPLPTLQQQTPPLQEEQPPPPTLQPQHTPFQLQQQSPQPPLQEVQQQPLLPRQDVQQQPLLPQQPPLQEEEQKPPPPQQEDQQQPPPPPQQEDQQQPPAQQLQQQQQGDGSQRRARGRPRGGGRVRQGMHGNPAICGLAPHIIIVDAGKDVSSKIMSLAQSGARIICVLSAIGSISNVTIRPVLLGDSSTYEGRFDILSLLGSFRLSDGNGPRSWTGGLTVSLIDPDGRILGGGVAGLLTAASPVQVAVACSMGDGGNLTESVVSPARPLAVAGPAGPRSPPSHRTLSEYPGVAGRPFNQTAEAADSTPDPLTISGSP